jgi:hypothetical protein
MARGTTIKWRPSACVGKSSDHPIVAKRYSATTGEIMWERVQGAIGYEIVRDGVSLGVHDVLSWYMTDLRPDRGYHLKIHAVHRVGPNQHLQFMAVNGYEYLVAFNQRYF